MSTAQRASSSPKRQAIRQFVQKLIERLFDKALDALVVGVVLVFFGAAATSIALWGEGIIEWMGDSQEVDRWLLFFLVSLGAVIPITGALALRTVNRTRFREPANVEIICTPTVIDLSGTGPSSAMATIRVTDSNGKPARNARVEMLAYSQVTENTSSLRTDKDGLASFSIDASKSMTPGILVAHAWVLRENALPLAASTEIACIGQPAFITLTGAPNAVIAGETVTVLATITDALNQNVWDGTQVQLKSSTGQMTSGIVDTFGGVAMDFLLTNVPGPCTIVGTVKGIGGVPVSAHLSIDVMPTPHQAAS